MKRTVRPPRLIDETAATPLRMWGGHIPCPPDCHRADKRFVCNDGGAWIDIQICLNTCPSQCSWYHARRRDFQTMTHEERKEAWGKFREKPQTINTGMTRTK